jgi:hypothetical protein
MFEISPGKKVSEILTQKRSWMWWHITVIQILRRQR